MRKNIKDISFLRLQFVICDAHLRKFQDMQWNCRQNFPMDYHHSAVEARSIHVDATLLKSRSSRTQLQPECWPIATTKTTEDDCNRGWGVRCKPHIELSWWDATVVLVIDVDLIKSLARPLQCRYYWSVAFSRLVFSCRILSCEFKCGLHDITVTLLRTTHSQSIAWIV